MNTYFGSLEKLVPASKRAAMRWIYDGKATPENIAKVRASINQVGIYGDLTAKVGYTRDTGHHSGGWWKNPDYERCFHLSLSFGIGGEDAPFMRNAADIIARAFWGDKAPWAWVEPPYSDEGRVKDIWHYRLFCDPSWSPIQPRGEVYSRENTPADWLSFSEVHGLTANQVDAPFLLNAT